MRVSFTMTCVLLLGACGNTGNAADAGALASEATGMDDPDASGGSGGDGMLTDMPPPMMTGLIPSTMPDPGGSVPGVGDEDTPCAAGSDDCNEGFSCAGLPEPYDGVCGRSCTADSECEEDEVCNSYLATGPPICINLVPAWDIYQYDRTSFCDDGLIPIDIAGAPPELRGGLCLQLCALEGADTSTLTPTELALVAECTGEHDCMPILSAPSGTGDPILGACGLPVDRGDSCDTPDSVCSSLDDACFPLDLSSAGSDVLCLQDCTDEEVTCETGTCDEIPGANGQLSICGWVDAGGTAD